MGRDDPSASEPPGPLQPWAHRSWCAPGCDFASGAAEGTHLGAPWVLSPAEEVTSRIAVRLVEEVNETETGVVRVLVSVTERRLADDLDPFGEFPGQSDGGTGLADITSSVGLDAHEAGRVFEQLVVFARLARALGTEAGEGRDAVGR